MIRRIASLLLLLVPAAMLISQEKSPLPRARQLESAKQFEQANELLSDYTRRNPKDMDAWVELGRVQLQQRLSDDAMRSYAAALAIAPNSHSAREGEVKAAIESALADRKAGDNDGALGCLDRARKLVPDSPELLTDFGIQADSMQIYEDAEKALARAHELAPNDPKTLYALAHVQLDEQKMADAEANLRAYLKLKPGDASAHYGLGHLLHMMLRDDQAKSELERSIALQPAQTASYYELGEIALQMGQNSEAKSDYTKVLSVDPRHGGALTGMGILAYRAKNYNSAEQYLTEAVLCAPDYVEAHHYYALVLAQLGDTQGAARESALAGSLRMQQDKLRHGYFLITPSTNSTH